MTEWTTTPPTKPGWWWYSKTGYHRDIVLVKRAIVGNKHRNYKKDDMVAMTDQGDYPVIGFADYWLGPLPVPSTLPLRPPEVTSKMTTNDYARHAFWSDDDNCYIAIAQAFKGVSAFGDTEQAALEELLIPLQAAIEIHRGRGGRRRIRGQRERL